MAGKIRGYLPDETTRYDMPSLLVLAAGYEFTPRLRATSGRTMLGPSSATITCSFTASNRKKNLNYAHCKTPHDSARRLVRRLQPAGTGYRHRPAHRLSDDRTSQRPAG